MVLTLNQTIGFRIKKTLAIVISQLPLFIKAEMYLDVLKLDMSYCIGVHAL
jgi:hypothetical protein